MTSYGKSTKSLFLITVIVTLYYLQLKVIYSTSATVLFQSALYIELSSIYSGNIIHSLLGEMSVNLAMSHSFFQDWLDCDWIKVDYSFRLYKRG